jgi:protein-S-isoprenylcysteine O-methyltransferase Ste14
MARVILALSVSLGGLSLLGFGLFLAAGPFELLPLGLAPAPALAWDAALCLVFFAQHSGMVRRGFQARVARFVPTHFHPAVYSIASGVALFALVLLWQRSEVVLASASGVWRLALRALFLATGPGFLWAVRSLGSLDAFGVGPVRAHRAGREPRRPPLVVRGPYRWVRHPLYSLLLVMIWVCPDLTADRLLFNALFTAWIVVGTFLEERDLARDLGEPYREYQRQVPMLVPWKPPGPLPNGVTP